MLHRHIICKKTLKTLMLLFNFAIRLCAVPIYIRCLRILFLVTNKHGHEVTYFATDGRMEITESSEF